jgi:C1A family cysteine protease
LIVFSDKSPILSLILNPLTFMSLEFKDKDGSVRAVKGYSYMAPNPAAKSFRRRKKGRKTKLPVKVDLRPFMTKVEDQQRLSSCTANATAGAYEYLAKKHLKNRAFEVSRLFVYYNARLRASNVIKDSGSHIQYAIESLHKLGACTEEVWPYDMKKVNDKPHTPSYEEACNFKVQKSYNIPTDLNAWKKCLADGYPIIFGISLFKGFDSCSQNKGVVPMPSPDEASRQAHGLHAMLCVGYSEVDKLFIIRNSWGEKWGDKGYCYMPYDYVINSKFNMGDSWMIARTAPIPDVEASWKEDKKSVVDNGKGYDKSSFVTYPEKAYSSFNPLEGIEYDEYEESANDDYDELEFYAEDEEEEVDDLYGAEDDDDEFEDEEEEEESDEEEEEEYDDEEEEEESDEEEEESDEDEEEESDEEEEEEYEEEEEEESDEEEEEESDEEEEEEYDEEEEEESDEEEEEEYDEEEEEESDEEEEEESDEDEEEEYDEEEEEEYEEEEEEESEEEGGEEEEEEE